MIPSFNRVQPRLLLSPHQFIRHRQTRQRDDTYIVDNLLGKTLSQIVPTPFGRITLQKIDHLLTYKIRRLRIQPWFKNLHVLPNPKLPK
ncbi:unnamed protein product [Linum trigynum]|uniref:Uncharacterized protein n=1 Tax=Linum trigynum TaxID=586398 RepID=A0AAV2FA85_9ROSI